MWKLLEVLGGVAELARECCEERGADLVLYPPLSRMHGQDAAPVQHALAVVEVLRVALAAQLSWCWTLQRNSESWLRWPTAAASLQSSAQSLTVSPTASLLLLSLAHCAPPPPTGRFAVTAGQTWTRGGDQACGGGGAVG